MTRIPVPANLRDVLVCPKCKGDLEFPSDRDEVRCAACRLVFPVIDELPMMVVDETTTEDDSHAANEKPTA